jgi:hypothetical protein
VPRSILRRPPLSPSRRASEEEEWSDDEDTSWKVRRAAAKAVSAVVTHYPDLLAEVYPQVAPVLLPRFREREETVKQDVFQVGAMVGKGGQGIGLYFEPCTSRWCLTRFASTLD